MVKQEIKQKRLSKRIVIALVSLVVLVVVAALAIRQIYNKNLQPLSNSEQIIILEVASGSSAKQIGDSLEEKGVIKQSWAFNWYVRSNGYIENLKAGTYALRPSQSVPEIVDLIAQGDVATDLVTILPGQRIDQVRAALINGGFSPNEVDEALEPSNYVNHPALVDKPKNASLEGYLYPESFQKTADTSAKQIVSFSLDEMAKRLSPSIRKAITKQGISIYEGVILASIVEQEVPKNSDRPLVASVFYNRLRSNTLLQSDATAGYGAILDGKEPSLTYDSAYNTYENKGLPPTPISNFSESALKAVANPAKTDYLYFVSGDDGNTYFSKTLEEHNAAVEKHCKKLCQ